MPPEPVLPATPRCEDDEPPRAVTAGDDKALAGRRDGLWLETGAGGEEVPGASVASSGASASEDAIAALRRA